MWPRTAFTSSVVSWSSQPNEDKFGCLTGWWRGWGLDPSLMAKRRELLWRFFRFYPRVSKSFYLSSILCKLTPLPWPFYAATSVLFREDESGGEILRLGAKVILEKHLRYFTVLSQGQVIPIFFNGRLYKLKIEETQPGPDVIIIDADINVDFLRPMLEEHASGVASPSLLGEPDFNWQPGDSTTIQFLRKWS